MAPWPTSVAKASVRSFIVLSRPADSSLIEVARSLVRSFKTLSSPTAPWPTEAANASVRSFSVLSRMSAPCDTVVSSALMREASVVVRASVRSFKVWSSEVVRWPTATSSAERLRAAPSMTWPRRSCSWPSRSSRIGMCSCTLLCARSTWSAASLLRATRSSVSCDPALGELLVDARARGGKVARDLLTDAAQGLADPLAVVGERLALAGELADQAADAELVVAVGALERRHLVMHEGFELAGAADGARDGVVHGGDLAADGLSQGGDRLLGELVGLGKAHRDLGHGRGHQPQFLGAPDEQRQEPENRDRHENGDGGGERRRVGEEIGGAVGRGKLLRDQSVGKEAADDEPDERGDQRDEERRLGRLLLQGEDQAADRGQIVVGGGCGHPARRWACGTARAGCCFCGCGGGIAEIGWLLLIYLGFRRLALLLGPEPLGKRQLLLSLSAEDWSSGSGASSPYVARRCPLDVKWIVACAPSCRSRRRSFRLFLRHHASLAQTNLEKTCAVHSNYVASGAGVVSG